MLESCEHYEAAAARAPGPLQAAADLRTAADVARAAGHTPAAFDLLLASAEQARAAGDDSARPGSAGLCGHHRRPVRGRLPREGTPRAAASAGGRGGPRLPRHRPGVRRLREGRRRLDRAAREDRTGPGPGQPGPRRRPADRRPRPDQRGAGRRGRGAGPRRADSRGAPADHGTGRAAGAHATARPAGGSRDRRYVPHGHRDRGDRRRPSRRAFLRADGPSTTTSPAGSRT